MAGQLQARLESQAAECQCLAEDILGGDAIWFGSGALLAVAVLLREAAAALAGEERLERYIASHRTYKHNGIASHDKALDDQLRALEQALTYVRGDDEYLNAVVDSRLFPLSAAPRRDADTE